MKLNCFEITLSLTNSRATEILKVVRDMDLHLRARLKLDENGLTLHWKVQDSLLDDQSYGNRQVEAIVSVIKAEPSRLYDMSAESVSLVNSTHHECLAESKLKIITGLGDDVYFNTPAGDGVNRASDWILGEFSMMLRAEMFHKFNRDGLDKIVQEANTETFGDRAPVRS